MEDQAKNTVFKNRFNSISEIINDPYFISFVNENISKLRKNRINRPEPKQGYMYKRSWYDRMSESGSLNVDFFIKNIESIWNKKSSLSSEIRSVIKFVCDDSLQQTLLKYIKDNGRPGKI